ncbi:SGNH/GDSL hydrolase family protein [Coraliomargarita sp. SDUM461004]|uniref:SGNH/GDSL hydrolase family protein n=1 Tax=Thalassobacterium sedimentorum TaxID=3041258 RepID=A0ABU1AJ50_9BACT|nr:SGNH/GDSL hydrolase family protein [Coraliomargarita sp. SDUM461004]MDQ8194774.1 SGNH/GDSL hydrolase family protein [Coraliomargarita sp. SDUM461004]
MNLPQLYVLGDSISLQYGPFLERFVQGYYRYDRKGGESEAFKDLDIPVGANCGDSSRVLEIAQALLANDEFRPQVILMNAGLHDIKRDVQSGEIQVPLEAYRANLKAAIELCQDKGIAVVWARTTPVSDVVHNYPGVNFFRHSADLVEYNAVADEVMLECAVPSIDLEAFTAILNEKDQAYCDHVHFIESVREKQGIFIAGYLIARLAILARASGDVASLI